MELRTLRQLEEQHRDLVRRRRSAEHELRALAKLAQRGAEAEAALMRSMNLLAALRRELKEHLGLEERVGLLAAATQAAPRLSRRARRLGREHAGLEAALGQILDDLIANQASPEQWAGSAAAFERFSETLVAHEQAEEEMVREAFMEDLGGGA